MKFERAWELMQEGNCVKRENWKGSYCYFSNGEIFYCYDNGSKKCLANTLSTTFFDVLSDDWILAEKLITEHPKKVFISQPMAGKTREQIITERIQALEEVTRILGTDVEIIDTVLNLGKDALPLEYLGESIKLLARADAIYMMDGWENARGCRIEHECAEAYGIPVIVQ